MSKQVGLLAMLAVVAVVGIAAVVAQAGGDPGQVECVDPYAAVGDVMPSDASVRSTPIEAAAGFVANMQADGKPIPADVELVDVSGSDTLELGGDKVIAARVDGRTTVLLGLTQEGEGWVVQSFISC
jgi:hypothetical protein